MHIEAESGAAHNKFFIIIPADHKQKTPHLNELKIPCR
jgi:hypothetical protein